MNSRNRPKTPRPLLTRWHSWETRLRHVVKNNGKIISLAGKFGIRAEEVPVMTKLAHEWKGKSVEDLGLHYERLMPDFKMKDDIMKTVLVFCDSGYTIPQGREIASYYYPLEYGLDKMIAMCQERRGEVAGNAGGTGSSA